MPLKFAPRGVKSDDSMRLAVLYTLRHDNAVILQTHAKARGCDAAPRIRPLPSFSDFLPCLTEGAEKEPQCIRIAPLQLSPLTLKSFSAAIEPTRLSLPPPPPQPQPSCVDVAENTSQLFPSLSAPHFNTPLVLSAHHGRQKCSWNRCAELLRRAVESNGLAATWEQMRSSFCAAWVAAVWVDASTCTLTSPPPIRMPPAALPLGKMEMQAALLVAESAAVPCRVQRRQCVRGMPPLRVDDIAGKLGEMRSAFAAQETSLKRHLFTVTHTAGGAVATTPPPAAAIATQTVMEVETPPLASDADNVCSKSLELMGVVIPPFSCIHTVKKGRRPERPRWAEENLIGVKNSMQQKLELVLSFIPNCMTRVTELRFPEGRHVRQTLTLQNIAKKSLQKLCGSHLHRQRQQQYRQKIAGLLSTEKCHVMRGRDLANVALLHSTALLLSADCLKPPQSCSAVRRNIGDDDIYHPPPPLLKPSLGVHASAVTGPSSSWPLILLGDQGEEDGGGNCGEGSRVGPWRVFPREEELHSFWRLMERRMERPVNDGGDVEEWYHAAFLHDIRTMPLPYQEIAALVDDARLHYCYRLALHREKRRIGLL